MKLYKNLISKLIFSCPLIIASTGAEASAGSTISSVEECRNLYLGTVSGIAADQCIYDKGDARFRHSNKLIWRPPFNSAKPEFEKFYCDALKTQLTADIDAYKAGPTNPNFAETWEARHQLMLNDKRACESRGHSFSMDPQYEECSASWTKSQGVTWRLFVVQYANVHWECRALIQRGPKQTSTDTPSPQ